MPNKKRCLNFRRGLEVIVTRESKEISRGTFLALARCHLVKMLKCRLSI